MSSNMNNIVINNQSITVNGRQYNGQAARQILLALAQYVANPTFPAGVVWVPGAHDLLTVRGPPGCAIAAVLCVAVGRIARERAFLGPNGSFNPAWSDPLKNAKASKWGIMLEDPFDPDFHQDWPALLAHLQEIQGRVAITGDKRHMMVGQKLKLSRNVWQAKSEENNTDVRNAITNNYPISRECADWWNLVKETHQIDLMPVYDIDDNLNTRVETWESDLIGALVEVTFTVKHYYMGVTPARPQAYDVFSATIESISVLVRPPPVVGIPQRENIARTKPRHVSQTASSVTLPTTSTASTSAPLPPALPVPPTLPATQMGVSASSGTTAPLPVIQAEVAAPSVPTVTAATPAAETATSSLAVTSLPPSAPAPSATAANGTPANGTRLTPTSPVESATPAMSAASTSTTPPSATVGITPVGFSSPPAAATGDATTAADVPTHEVTTRSGVENGNAESTDVEPVTADGGGRAKRTSAAAKGKKREVDLQEVVGNKRSKRDEE